MNTPLPIVMPRLRLALGVEQAVVVDDDVVADVDLVRMAQHDVLAEDDVRGRTTPSSSGYSVLRSARPERARHALREHGHELVLEQRRQPGRPTTSAAYFSRADCPASNSWSWARGIGVIGDHRRRGGAQLRASHAARYHASVRRMPSRSPTCGA